MANETYYVSKSTDNGFVVGNDTNDGLTLATPFLTIDKATDTAMLATGAVTVILNDGSYVGTDIDASNQYLIIGANPAFDSLTMKPYLSTATLVPGVATGCIRFTDTTGWDNTKTFTIQDITLGRSETSEGGADANYQIWIVGGAATSPTYNVTRVTVKNQAFYGVYCSGTTLANINITDHTHVSTRAVGRGMLYSATHGGGKITIDGGTVNHTQWNNSGNGIVYIDAAAAGVEVEIEDLAVIGKTVSGTGLMYGIFVANVDNAVASGCSVDLENLSGGAWSVGNIRLFGNDVTLTAASQKIHSCTASAAGFDSGGFLITVGGDGGSAQANVSDGSEIIGCTAVGDATFVANNGHGIGVVANDNCEMYGNTSSFADIGILSKLTTNCKVAGNLVKQCGLGGTSKVMYYNKGGTNDLFYNNTAIIDSDTDAVVFIAGIDGATNSTGAEFDNNYIYGQADAISQIIAINSGSDATFDYNHYYITGTVPNPSFTYTVTTYATVALWIAARETNGVVVTANPFNSDYTLIEGSTGVGASPNVGLTAKAIGFNGEPYPSNAIDIGGAPTTYGPFHPVNL